jgi:BirA family transcriptional regulator, biotin operon repressor / biotin---[acetyl-CoA-carboxylase] ligase
MWNLWPFWCESMADWLHRFETLPSTNTWAMAQGDDLGHGDVVYTARQTAGRGQFDRNWYAPPGVLTASFVLDGLPAERQVGFSLAVGLSLIYSLEDLLPTVANQLQLKWPNDLWYGQRKLAGILCEAKGERTIVGIGCNLQADFSTVAENRLGNPISLHEIDPQGIAALMDDTAAYPVVILSKIRRYLLEALAVVRWKGLEPLLPALQQRDGLRGRELQVELPSGAIAGTGAGIDTLGRLQIALPHAPEAILAVAAGRVLL